MKTTKAILAGTLLALVMGCATTFNPWSLDQIQEGMDREQVILILGEPDQEESKNEQRVLYYTYRMIPRTGEDPFFDPSTPMKEDQYAVTLKSGKVTSHRKLED